MGRTLHSYNKHPRTRSVASTTARKYHHTFSPSGSSRGLSFMLPLAEFQKRIIFRDETEPEAKKPRTRNNLSKPSSHLWVPCPRCPWQAAEQHSSPQLTSDYDESSWRSEVGVGEDWPLPEFLLPRCPTFDFAQAPQHHSCSVELSTRILAHIPTKSTHVQNMNNRFHIR